MGCPAGCARLPRPSLLFAAALLPLLASCQVPVEEVAISPRSSLLAVEVSYPLPRARDPALVRAFFVREPLPATGELPPILASSFVKGSRAYLLDPEPGTYALVATTSAVAPPKGHVPVAGGVEKPTLGGTFGRLWIVPVELGERTRTAIGPGGVAFMGSLRVAEGDRVDADATFAGPFERGVAERLRPGVTSERGFAAWLAQTFLMDPELSSLRRDPAAERSFVEAARRDLGESAWTQVVARAAPPSTTPRASVPAPAPESRAASPPKTSAAAPEPRARIEVPQARATGAPAEPRPPGVAPEAAPPPPARAPEIRERHRFEGLPPGSPLAEVESGMDPNEVRELLGAPDRRSTRYTAKAWIPFYAGADARSVHWIYEGEGRVVFSFHRGFLAVIDVAHDPQAR